MVCIATHTPRHALLVVSRAGLIACLCAVSGERQARKVCQNRRRTKERQSGAARCAASHTDRRNRLQAWNEDFTFIRDSLEGVLECRVYAARIFGDVFLGQGTACARLRMIVSGYEHYGSAHSLLLHTVNIPLSEFRIRNEVSGWHALGGKGGATGSAGGATLRALRERGQPECPCVCACTQASCTCRR